MLFLYSPEYLTTYQTLKDNDIAGEFINNSVEDLCLLDIQSMCKRLIGILTEHSTFYNVKINLDYKQVPTLQNGVECLDFPNGAQTFLNTYINDYFIIVNNLVTQYNPNIVIFGLKQCSYNNPFLLQQEKTTAGRCVLRFARAAAG